MTELTPPLLKTDRARHFAHIQKRARKCIKYSNAQRICVLKTVNGHQIIQIKQLYDDAMLCLCPKRGQFTLVYEDIFHIWCANKAERRRFKQGNNCLDRDLCGCGCQGVSGLSALLQKRRISLVLTLARRRAQKSQLTR